MYHQLKQCRACGSTDLIEVFDLGAQPLANDFCGHDQERAGLAPLKVLHCDRCTLAQLSVVVRPDILYANYPYVTSTSRMMKDHFDHLIRLLKQRPHRTLLEIGSNDGGFLNHCREAGIEWVTGIDPADNLVKEANARGLPSIAGTFNQATASQTGPADLVVARHVFCHVNDWRQFIEDLALVTHENSTVFIEVPYLLDMLSRVEFDTIYHEHTSYLSITAILRLLEGTPWFLEQVERFQIHGGAVGLFLRRRQYSHGSDPVVARMCLGEAEIMPLWQQFETTARERISRLSEVVSELNELGNVVCGFGASAKSTVWVNACGFNRRNIAFICDCTPNKIGRFSPGTDIPVVAETKLDMATHAVLFCWNFKDEVLSRQAAFRAKGGKFIVPIPNLTIE